jgi:hypothetical protein
MGGNQENIQFNMHLRNKFFVFALDIYSILQRVNKIVTDSRFYLVNL